MLFNRTPLDKLQFIQSLQKRGDRVMMVGDGLNDAGALRQSDVGVAVVEKVGAFSPASDVILRADQVSRLDEILALSRRAVRIVRLGFGISACYNIFGISIAAAGLLSPLVCAILMPVSSISVVLFACGATAWAARGLDSPSPGKESGDWNSARTLKRRERRAPERGSVSRSAPESREVTGNDLVGARCVMQSEPEYASKEAA